MVRDWAHKYNEIGEITLEKELQTLYYMIEFAWREFDTVNE